MNDSENKLHVKQIKLISQDNQIPDSKKKKTNIKRKYLIILFGIVLVASGYVSIFNLQSSIRVQDGLGSKMAAITYSVLNLFSFFVVPVLVRLLGPKKALVLAETGYLIYIITNAFSNKIFLYIGALVAGFAESVLWIPVGICFVYFAKKYHVYSDKTLEECVMKFGGLTMGIYQLSQVLGNSVTSLVLNILKSDAIQSHKNNTNEYHSSTAFPLNNFPTAITVATSETVTNLRDTDTFQYCGANDCQDKEVIEESIDHYVPRNPFALYVIIGFCLLMTTLGMIIHIRLIPEMPLSSYNSTTRNNEEKENDDNEDDNYKPKKKTIKQILIISFKTSKDLILQFFNPHHLFGVGCYGIYIGLNSAFVFNESTRMFSSCVLGVNMIGCCIIIYSSFNGLQCFLIGKVFGQRGRIPLLIFSVLFDVSLFLLCLLWHPTSQTKWVVYVIFGLLGISNGTGQIITSTTYGNDCYKTKEISFNLWMITFSIGYSLQNAISTQLCVRYKLYMMMATVCVTAFLAGVQELFFVRKVKK